MKEVLKELRSIALPQNETAEPKKEKSAAKPRPHSARYRFLASLFVSELGPVWRDDRRRWETTIDSRFAESGCAVLALVEMLSRKIRNRTTKYSALCVEPVYL